MEGAGSDASSNAGACVPGVEDCWDVDSSVRFIDPPQGGKDGNDVEHLKTTVKQSMRSNPVPGI